MSMLYPLNYRIVATLRAPKEATEQDIRRVLALHMPALTILEVKLEEECSVVAPTATVESH